MGFKGFKGFRDLGVKGLGFRFWGHLPKRLHELSDRLIDELPRQNKSWHREACFVKPIFYLLKGDYKPNIYPIIIVVSIFFSIIPIKPQ